MKILLADDHALLRDGIKLMLRRLNDLATILEADSFTAINDCFDAHTDIQLLLLDLKMPGALPFEGLKDIRRKRPRLPIIVLSASENPDDVKIALELGANGYVPKSSSNETLLGAIRLVLAGGTYLPLELFEKAGELPAAEYPPTGTEEEHRNLTRRQLEILRHLVAGKTNREIGAALSISETTVKSHVTTIFRSLDVTNRTQAVLRTIELGWFPDTERI